MNIIELARKENIVPYIISPRNDEYLGRLQAFAAAVIKAHEAKLIEDAGEPAHHIMVDGQCIGYYSATQVAGAVAKGNVSAYQRGYLDGMGKDSKRITELEAENDRLSAHMTELRDLHTKRIATLESTLRVALEALDGADSSLSDYYAEIEWGAYDLKNLVSVRAAAEQIKEVLNAE